MRPSVWAAVAAGLWVLCTVIAEGPPALPALALPLAGAPDAGGCQGAEGPLRGRGAELGAAQLLLPPQEGSSAAIVLRSAPPRGPGHRGRPGSAQRPAPLGAAPRRRPDPGAAGGRGEGCGGLP
uniref:Interferon lambda 4 (gene/pseudogene) n=1 Tax=Homo sapiens TaxID=9606 RepID=K9M1I6_HUMAN|nr:hypothetical protein [Homo sapiens]